MQSIPTLTPRPFTTRAVSACDTLIENKLRHIEPCRKVGVSPEQVRELTRDMRPRNPMELRWEDFA